MADTMDPVEKAAFEIEMNANEQLAKDIKLEQKLLLGISLAGDEDLKKVIADTDERLSAQRFLQRECHFNQC
ncbi:MAG: hypothetical protein IPM82_16250 [Saprospiraceae bacterium]|nr:hypothetical protein [Saprospiraceae bacterium]